MFVVVLVGGKREVYWCIGICGWCRFCSIRVREKLVIVIVVEKVIVIDCSCVQIVEVDFYVVVVGCFGL